MIWRSLGDSNPCFRRERAKLAFYCGGHLEVAPRTAQTSSLAFD